MMSVSRGTHKSILLFYCDCEDMRELAQEVVAQNIDIEFELRSISWRVCWIRGKCRTLQSCRLFLVSAPSSRLPVRWICSWCYSLLATCFLGTFVWQWRRSLKHHGPLLVFYLKRNHVHSLSIICCCIYSQELERGLFSAVAHIFK